MNSIELTDDDVRYVIRFVPLAEARELQRDGTKMYDYSALTAIDTCPTYGVLRYGLHKTDMPLTTGGRRMALEAGKACHDYYAALRMWTLLEKNIRDDRALEEVERLHKHGLKLFGEPRWTSMMDQPQDTGNSVNNATLFALEALHTSGFYDDPDDKRRTMQNLEVACMAYTDRYFQSDMPVLVRDDFIGVECPFVLEVTHITKGNYADDAFEKRAYYCGRIDGVQTWGDKLVVCENKSASRIGDAWRTSFAISHQVTGYTIAGSCMLGELVDTAFVMGMQIPPTRDIYSGVAFEILSRTDSDRLRWCEWFMQGVAKYEQWTSDPTRAPRYSHSCNRYFSACQFIPVCASTREEQVELIEGMHVEVWSPLDHLDAGHETVEE